MVDAVALRGDTGLGVRTEFLGVEWAGDVSPSSCSAPPAPKVSFCRKMRQRRADASVYLPKGTS